MPRLIRIIGIYKITSLTGKIYIGQSVNILDRFNRYKNLHLFGKYHNGSKKIIQFDLNGNEIKQWHGALEVERETGFKCAYINRASRGERITAYNYKWKYA